MPQGFGGIPVGLLGMLRGWPNGNSQGGGPTPFGGVGGGSQTPNGSNPSPSSGAMYRYGNSPPPMASFNQIPGIPGGGRDMNFSPDPHDQIRCAMGDVVACQRIQQARSNFENSYQYQLQQLLNQQALSSRAGNPYGQPIWSRGMGTSNTSHYRGIRG